MKQQVNIKKLDDRAIIPTYGTAFSAGADLYACMDHAVTIAPGETYLVLQASVQQSLKVMQGLFMREAGWQPRKVCTSQQGRGY